jgi:hypothetical protein
VTSVAMILEAEMDKLRLVHGDDAPRYRKERNSMLIEEIRKELVRLNLHPVNLAAASVDDDRLLLAGSLLVPWNVPAVVDGTWFLALLNGLPDAAGGHAVMEQFSAACATRAAAGP